MPERFDDLCVTPACWRASTAQAGRAAARSPGPDEAVRPARARLTARI